MKPGSREAKDTLFAGFAQVARALSSGRRVEIADVLAQGERSVEELSREIGQSVANTSHHLHVMAAAGIVTSRREGTRVYYALAGGRVEELVRALVDVATDRIAAIERLAADYLGDRSGLEEVTREELLERMDRGDAVVVDVRPRTEYEAGHIAGAIPVPVSELRSWLRDLPPDTEVVAYCRGPYCVYADEAVRLLKRRGRRARRLVDGFPEWRAAGLPVSRGGVGA